MTGLGMLLTDIPCPAFQAIVERLSDRDVASLRLISAGACEKTTHVTPSITLRLSGPSSNPSTQPNHPAGLGSSTQHGSPAGNGPSTNANSILQQLRSWRQGTRCFDHVPAVHVTVSGKLSTQQWSAALRVLALRGNVKALHITSAPHSSSSSGNSAHSTAAIPSLLPVRQLLLGLTSLAVEGVTVTNMSEDVTLFLAPSTPSNTVHPAAAAATPAGFKNLQHLNLSCGWSPSGSLRDPAAFTAAVAQLPHTFPALAHMTLQLPALSAPSHPYVAPNAAQVAAAGGAAAANAAAAAARASATATAAAQHSHAQVCMLAAAVAAAVSLPRLQSLDLGQVPDIWAAPGPAAAAAAMGGIVPAAVFRSLDDLGSWLLLQSPLLTRLQIDAVGASCCMAWERDTACAAAATSSSSSGVKVVVVPPPAVKLTYHAGMRPARPVAAQTASGAATSLPLTSSSSSSALSLDLSAHLSKYSRRPAAALVSSITSLQAAIHPDQLASVAAALAAMPALRSLKLTVLATSSKPTDFAALVTAAAATGDRLLSLTLLPGLGRVECTATALLPLVAVAGSTLRELRLVGNFGTTTTSGSSSSATTSSSSSSSGACSESPWGLLRDVKGLQVLRVHQVGSGVLHLPLDCLPAGLRVFDAKRLHLVEAAAAAAAAGSSGEQTVLPFSSSSRVGVSSLEGLSLQDCRLDAGSISSLSSSSLRQLAIAATDIPGGWPAAVAAWPHLKHLTLWCPAVNADHVGPFNSHGDSISLGVEKMHAAKMHMRHGAKRLDAGQERIESFRSAAAAAAAAAAEQAAVGLLRELAGFRELEGLELQHLPHMSAAGLHVLTCHMPHLSQLVVSAARVANNMSVGVTSAAAALGSSSSHLCTAGMCEAGGCRSGSLKYASVRLPAVRPRAAAAAAAAAVPAGQVGASDSVSSSVSVAGSPAASAAAYASSSNSTTTTATTTSSHIYADVHRSVVQVMPWCGLTVAADMFTVKMRC